MGMPQPGGSVQVTERAASLISYCAGTSAFFAWWLIFWAAWDRLLRGQIFGNTETGPASGDVVLLLGAFLAILAISLLTAQVFWRFWFRRREKCDAN